LKKYFIKYVLEFLVIVIGISLSFYFEKQNAISYKEELKNQSLKRILKNIEVDIEDYNFNIEAHELSIKSANWLYERFDDLPSQPKDSVGYHFGIAITVNTIFVDNQEEYRGLQNSGLLELIENDQIVIGLQNKYTRHDFLKKIEEFIIKNKEPLFDYLYKNTKLISRKVNNLGLPYDRTYIGRDVTNEIIERINESITWHTFYLTLVQNRKKNDFELVNLIKSEIN